MRKSEITKMPSYFDRYINLVPDIEVLDALKQYDVSNLHAIKENLLSKADYAYAPDKWTVKQLMQHINDTERIFAYRALRMGRMDPSPLTSFDENEYIKNCDANKRTMDSLIDEFDAIRKSTIILYENLNDDAMVYVGVASGNENTALAIGFTIVGHFLHHMKVLEERYF